jgi:hypothetical protein
MKCSIPTCHKSLRRFYVDGRFSINNNLPRPTVQLLDDHSYVSIKDCLFDFFGHGKHDIVSFDHSSELCFGVQEHVSNVFESNFGQNILTNCQERMISTNPSNPVVPVLLLFWSDDFEPSQSIKSNGQSVWIKTMTIIVLNSSSNNTSAATYPVAIGKKESFHEEVEQKIVEELRSLNSGSMPVMFSNSLKTLINVHAETFCILNDQPERRSGAGLAAGSSNFHRRWGYSCDIKKYVDEIPACEQCMQQIRAALSCDRFTWKDVPCTDCMKWMLFQEKECPLSLNSKLDNAITNNSIPFKLSLAELALVVNQVHEHVVSQKMVPKDAEIILRCFCLSNKLSDNIIQNAKNCLVYQIAMNCNEQQD